MSQHLLQYYLNEMIDGGMVENSQLYSLVTMAT